MTWEQSSRVVPVLSAIFLLVLFAACVPSDSGSSDPCGTVDVSHEGLVLHRPCGGCDPRCWVTSDTPVDPDEVVLDGIDQNGEDVEFGTSDGVTGIILGESEGGVDSDGDGIPDSIDPSPSDPQGDADGDNIPDAWEHYLGTDMNVADTSPAADEIFVVLPYEGGEVTREIPPDIPMTVRSADVYFLIDTTGSMSGEIANLRASLSSYVVPEVQDTIADVQFGVGTIREYSNGLMPYEHLIDITSNISAVQSALDSMGTHNNVDYPEAQTCALHAVATGEGIGCGFGAASCPSGRIGYPCFRPEAQPIIVLVTDAQFHNGVWDDLNGPVPVGGYNIGCYEYSNSGCDSDFDCIPNDTDCPSLQHVVTELNDIGAKVVGIWSNWPYDLGHVSTWDWGRTYPDFDEALDIYFTGLMTESVNAGGDPFLYGISTDGSGLDAEVVNGIDELVATMLLDVSSHWTDPDPAAPDSAVLVNDVDPTACSMCDSIDNAANIAYGVHPGSTVSFQVSLSNDTGDIPPTAASQEFEVRVQIKGNGTSILSERSIRVLVPGTDTGSTAATSGRYWHVYDALDNCLPENTVQWARLYYDAEIPTGTGIEFSVRTATSRAALATATPVPLTFSSGAMSAEIHGALEDAGEPTTARFLAVEARLTADVPGDTPVLTDLTVEHYCL